jgi:hypothetical protein
MASDCVPTTQSSQVPLTPPSTESLLLVSSRLAGTAYVSPSQTSAATQASQAVRTTCPLALRRTPNTSTPATIVKNPKTRSGARASIMIFWGKRTTRVSSDATSTTRPTHATARRVLDSQSGPKVRPAVDTIPVAITNENEEGARCWITAVIRPSLCPESAGSTVSIMMFSTFHSSSECILLVDLFLSFL